ncbi:unnamed protein product [Chondrus crispus]|uniref:Uncharacterized protein n=1 Tax=Chondrus crispus TaxID=2769 RepID=R7QJ80_CHOCR|nr:unnamed protein product [Chondrus crispus]CDF37465.1 unnamed protein product [Chondrus crispus]|eukprot:XP_005717284.1 unnamed protein product [Chondrus crispus]
MSAPAISAHAASGMTLLHTRSRKKTRPISGSGARWPCGSRKTRSAKSSWAAPQKRHRTVIQSTKRGRHSWWIWRRNWELRRLFVSWTSCSRGYVVAMKTRTSCGRQPSNVRHQCSRSWYRRSLYTSSTCGAAVASGPRGVGKWCSHSSSASATAERKQWFAARLMSLRGGGAPSGAQPRGSIDQWMSITLEVARKCFLSVAGLCQDVGRRLVCRAGRQQ